jgi:SET domain-containing protein
MLPPRHPRRAPLKSSAGAIFHPFHTPRSSCIFPAAMIQRRRSKIAGWGVYATGPINKNKRIVTYDGEKINNKECLRRERKTVPRGEIWCFTLNRLYVRDAAVGGNVARYINHSCKPNCYTTVIGDTIWIIAARNIRRGEELTYNYNTEGTAGIACRCRPGCKTVI